MDNPLRKAILVYMPRWMSRKLILRHPETCIGTPGTRNCGRADFFLKKKKKPKNRIQRTPTFEYKRWVDMTMGSKLVFSNCCQPCLPQWMLTVWGRQPTYIADISHCKEITDKSISEAFHTFAKYITGTNMLMSRLSHALLVDFFDELEKLIINQNRKKGWVNRDNGYGDASIALDIYLDNQHR